MLLASARYAYARLGVNFEPAPRYCTVSPWLRQVLLLTLIAMSYLLYKNPHRAKAFLLGFLNFELVLVVEVCPLHHLTIKSHLSVATHLSVCSYVLRCGTSRAYPPHPASFLHMLRS